MTDEFSFYEAGSNMPSISLEKLDEMLEKLNGMENFDVEIVTNDVKLLKEQVDYLLKWVKKFESLYEWEK